MPLARDYEEGYPESYFTRCMAAAAGVEAAHCAPGRSIVLVSHAATCVAVVASLLGVSVREVEPAGAASLYQLRRRGGAPPRHCWHLAHASKRASNIVVDRRRGLGGGAAGGGGAPAAGVGQHGHGAVGLRGQARRLRSVGVDGGGADAETVNF